MATRALSVVVELERSPGGGLGMNMRVGDRHRFAIPCSDFAALSWTREQLVAQGAEKAERGRALRLLGRELLRRSRAVVTVEVRS
jgi:hypothetical protein